MHELFETFTIFFSKKEEESVNVLQMTVKSAHYRRLNQIFVLSITFKPRSSNELSYNMLILSFIFVLPLIGLQVFYKMFYKTHCRRHRPSEDNCPPHRRLKNSCQFSPHFRLLHTSILILRVHLLFLRLFAKGYGSCFGGLHGTPKKFHRNQTS